MSSPLSTTNPDSLDRTIIKCFRYKINVDPERNCIECNQFLFSCRSHSTGNTVSVSLYNKDRSKTLEIISGTYWFSSHYTFHSFKKLDGAWDKSLKQTIKQLEELVLQAELKEKEDERLAAEQKQKDQEKLIKEFEAQFL